MGGHSSSLRKPNRRRLKILGHARRVDRDAAVAAGFAGTLSESAIRIRLEGFDWNCPQYITPRYTETELAAVMAKASAP